MQNYLLPNVIKSIIGSYLSSDINMVTYLQEQDTKGKTLQDAIGGYDPKQYIALFTVNNRYQVEHILTANDITSKLLLEILDNYGNLLTQDMYWGLADFYCSQNGYEHKTKLYNLILRFPYLVLYNNIHNDVIDWYSICNNTNKPQSIEPFIKLAVSEPPQLTYQQILNVARYVRSCSTAEEHLQAIKLLTKNHPDIFEKIQAL